MRTCQSWGYIEPDSVLDKVEKMVSDDMVNMLVAPYCGEEVKEAFAQMHPTKASEPDGMYVLFHRKIWSMVGKDVIDKVLEVLDKVGRLIF